MLRHREGVHEKMLKEIYMRRDGNSMKDCSGGTVVPWNCNFFDLFGLDV
jgi:hypothetical protein